MYLIIVYLKLSRLFVYNIKILYLLKNNIRKYLINDGFSNKVF